MDSGTIQNGNINTPIPVKIKKMGLIDKIIISSIKIKATVRSILLLLNYALLCCKFFGCSDFGCADNLNRNASVADDTDNN